MRTAGLLTSQALTKQPPEISLRSSALIAGLGLSMRVGAAPFAERYVFPWLVVLWLLFVGVNVERWKGQASTMLVTS